MTERRRKAAIPAFAAILAFSGGGGRAETQGLLADHRLLKSTDGAFIVQYPPRLEPMARRITALLEEAADPIAADIGLETIAPIRVYIAGDDRTYRELHAGNIPEWGAAFSDIGNQVLGIRAAAVVSGPRSLSAVVRHELSHLLLAQRAGPVRIPTWFMEGLAMVQAGEWRFTDDWNLMLLVGRGRLPYLEELAGPFPRRAEEAALAYGLSYHAVRSLLADGPGRAATLTAFMRDRGDFEDAFFLTFGVTPYDFAARFYVRMDARYRTPGVILNAGPYWIAVAGLFIAAFIVKRVRTARRLREMEARYGGAERFFD